MNSENIVIVGGGPVGLSTAILFAKNGRKVIVLDKNQQLTADGRILALSYASILEFKQIGIDMTTSGTAITKVHVSNGVGVNLIRACDVNLDYLGYTVSYNDCMKLLRCEVNKYKNIVISNAIVNNVVPGKQFATVQYDKNSSTLKADLVIMAEGGNVEIENVFYKKYDYRQSAVVMKVVPEISHSNVAYERFEDNGSIAFLPYGKNFVVVWVLDDVVAYNLSNEDAIYKLSCLPFSKKFGKFQLVDDIIKFPLKFRVARDRVLDRVVLIGNSSQTIHPISAQGLNLGLRDVRDLYAVMGEYPDILGALRQYNEMRRKDVKFVANFTHFLARFMEAKNPIVRHITGVGMVLFGSSRSLQNKLTRTLIFGQ